MKILFYTNQLLFFTVIHDIIELWNDNISQSYLLFGHLNTDRGSYERNPSAYRFIRNLKEVILQNLKSAVNSGYENSETKSFIDPGI